MNEEVHKLGAAHDDLKQQLLRRLGEKGNSAKQLHGNILFWENFKDSLRTYRTPLSNSAQILTLHKVSSLN